MVEEGIRLYAAPTTPAPVDTKFTFVDIPDTQNEVVSNSTLIDHRMQWLVDNRAALDLRFVTQTGDMMNWDTPDNTTTFNTYFPVSRFQALAGVYETGKCDNAYHTFTAGGLHWLVLNLELWARTGVVDWAKTVVAAHPQRLDLRAASIRGLRGGSIPAATRARRAACADVPGRQNIPCLRGFRRDSLTEWVATACV